MMESGGAVKTTAPEGARSQSGADWSTDRGEAKATSGRGGAWVIEDCEDSSSSEDRSRAKGKEETNKAIGVKG